MKSRIIALLAAFSLVFALGCSDKELKTGKYVMQGTELAEWAWVILEEDGKFVFNRNLATSYLPIGTYTIEKGMLILSVSAEETYRFRIDGNDLIFESGKLAESFVEKGAIFRLSEITIETGKSVKFSEEEIAEAIDLVQTEFHFPSAKLTKLTYDEEKSEWLIKGYMQNGRGSVNGVDPKNVIILLSEFHVDGSGKNPVLNPNSTYTDYQWILIRQSENSSWIIDDQGY
ncbi:DUF4829 domain-containing protein [Youngiibacter fragilis]|uniref:DUF4829 domain-containing protein n=1 Tax=Youngiibacter fragilis 232.1 TaxID=994573 RepID=V7I1I3_9CLOT|nr:DUF4829 domain-containing protein [Youngiibacter fragilis]ETA79728.1 hypothetical protein T472_0214490 [Youngiibacter fragilis 232.1]